MTGCRVGVSGCRVDFHSVDAPFNNSHLSSGGIYVWWGTPCLLISTVGDGRYSHPLLRYQGLTARDEEQRPPTTTAGVFPLITSLISQCYFDRRWRSVFSSSPCFTKVSEGEDEKDRPPTNSRYPSFKSISSLTLISFKRKHHQNESQHTTYQINNDAYLWALNPTLQDNI